MEKSKKILLVILDGWGYGPDCQGNAITQARTPFFSSLIQNFPNNRLEASGRHVGLPDGQMGNSEIGHMTLGGGRKIEQDIVRINNVLKKNELGRMPVLQALFQRLARKGALHLMGLVSEGGVHSHISHLEALLKESAKQGLKKVYVHAFTDGRDTNTHEALGCVASLEEVMKKNCGEIATIMGRYYAMDRDRRWERTNAALNAICFGKGEEFFSARAAIEANYKNDRSDEFILPSVVLNSNQEPKGRLGPEDVLICFNFRSDRCRQISMKILETYPDLCYATMTKYADDLLGVKVIFEKEVPARTLGEILAENNMRQLRMAETEKYPHVTYFFSGGREDKFRGEDRILVPSPKVQTYDLKPEMSAHELTRKLVEQINTKEYQFICVNFANPDMVAHTGSLEATVSAVECVDECLKTATEAALNNEYSVIILSDHGNAEFLINDDGTPNTAHTLNKVPIILIDKEHTSIKGGDLADVAPTILKLLGIPIPMEMGGQALL